jgi:Ca2+:H+ antiporter
MSAVEVRLPSYPLNLILMAGQQPSDSSNSGAGGPGEDFSNVPQSPSYRTRITTHRSVSHGSQWMAADIPSHHNAGTSYSSQYSLSMSPSPRRKSLARGSSGSTSRQLRVRTTSATSLRVREHERDSGLLSEDDEAELKEGDLEAEQGDDGRGKRAAAVAAAAAEAADGSPGLTTEDDVDDEDPITLKDRQLLINVEHLFSLPIWKPALYKKSWSVT